MVHTPGPWDYAHPRTVTRRCAGSGIDYQIATAALDWGTVAAEANARLIAAAPGMLARLEQALVYLEHPDVQAFPFCKPVSAMAQQVREIIAEAKGGAR